MRRRMCTAAAIGALAITACGSDDDGGGGSDDGATATVAESAGDDAGGDDAGLAAELVPLSSLGLDIPFEVPWDLPVPADSTIALTTDAAGQQTVGLNSEAAVDPIAAEYDAWFPANFATVNADPAFRSWQGIEVTDSGSRGMSAAITTCSDCPDYSTRVLISLFES